MYLLCSVPHMSSGCIFIVQCSPHEQRLLWILSLLDCVEVTIEMMTQRFSGDAGKWGVVILMQFMRY